MKKVRFGICDIELYETIEEMPIVRWQKYNKYAIIDSGIGGDLTALDGHLQRISAYLRKDDKESAIKEIGNLRQNVFLIQTEQPPQLLSAACLIASIDGVPCNDLTEEGLRKVIDKVTDVPTNLFFTAIKVVKKKMDAEMEMYFPSLFQSADEKEYHDTLRKRTLAVVAKIQGKDTQNEINELTDDILTTFKPKSFDTTDNYEVGFDKQFERCCLAMSQRLNIDPKRCSVMEFYNAYETINDQIKQAKNGRNKSH